jgi:hypothetical protein
MLSDKRTFFLESSDARAPTMFFSMLALKEGSKLLMYACMHSRMHVYMYAPTRFPEHWLWNHTPRSHTVHFCMNTWMCMCMHAQTTNIWCACMHAYLYSCCWHMCQHQHANTSAYTHMSTWTWHMYTSRCAPLICIAYLHTFHRQPPSL